MSVMYRLLFTLIAAVTCFPSASCMGDEVDFATDVLPILSNKCFVCHGPDAKDGLVRLDSADAAYADLGGYRAINSSAPGESAALLRIHSVDDPMPPEEAEKQLTASERDHRPLDSRWWKLCPAHGPSGVRFAVSM